MTNDPLVKTLGFAPFSFQAETLINKISRQKGTTDTLMAHGFSVVCARDVFVQFFRWTLVASVDPSVKTPRDALETIKWRTKMLIRFRMTHAQTKCLRAVAVVNSCFVHLRRAVAGACIGGAQQGQHQIAHIHSQL